MYLHSARNTKVFGKLLNIRSSYKNHVIKTHCASYEYKHVLFLKYELKLILFQLIYIHILLIT